MAKTLEALARRLRALDRERHALVAGIKAATEALLAGSPATGRRGGQRADQRSQPNRGPAAMATSPASKPGGRRPGFKMSAAAKAKIAKAQKARWARVKSNQKGGKES